MSAIVLVNLLFISYINKLLNYSCIYLCFPGCIIWGKNTYGMLCGEIIRSPNRSPYATLLSSLYPMMTAAVVEDDNLLGNY